MKKINNGQLRVKDLNTKVTLYGWVSQIRKLSKVTFLNLRDRWGSTQLVFRDAKFTKSICKESVLKVTGLVKKRHTTNPEMPTGEIEVFVEKWKILSTASCLPVDFQTQKLPGEDLRLKHRHLDLRTPRMTKNLTKRHEILQLLRNSLSDQDFVEVSTPVLSSSTPEGARDFLVPTRFRSQPSFFALPQSPQIYKQLLMIGGLEKYFQIAPVFRDETPRNNRQIEFTQLDLEMSFVSAKDIQQTIEHTLANVLRKAGYLVKTPFAQIRYDKSVQTYGTDSPDLTCNLKITDLTSCLNLINTGLKTKEIQALKGVHTKEFLPLSFFRSFAHGVSKGLKVPLVIFTYKNNKVQNTTLRKNAFAFLKKNVKVVVEKFNFLPGTYFLACGSLDQVNLILGRVIKKAKKVFNLSTPGLLRFVWITNLPLFKYDKKLKKHTSFHHPFTLPKKKWQNNFAKNLDTAEGESFDLVLNGNEIGSGSLRIKNALMQSKVFEVLKMNKKITQQKFQFFLDALKCGTPPHGGIAIGLDRLLAVILNENSIRDTIAFPKNSKGLDPLTGAPSGILPDQWKECKIKKA